MAAAAAVVVAVAAHFATAASTAGGTAPGVVFPRPTRLFSPSRLNHLLLLRLSRPVFITSPLKASRRPHDVVVVPNPRAWVDDFSDNGIRRDDNYKGEEGDEDDDEDEEEEDDRSLDLLVRFVHSLFRKISRRARRAVRTVLPPTISTSLVRFSVNGVLILASLWIMKALLEVVCTFGSMVFLSILCIRGIWSGVIYFRDSQYNYLHRINNDDRRWSSVQPVV